MIYPKPSLIKFSNFVRTVLLLVLLISYFAPLWIVALSYQYNHVWVIKNLKLVFSLSFFINSFRIGSEWDSPLLGSVGSIDFLFAVLLYERELSVVLFLSIKPHTKIIFPVYITTHHLSTFPPFFVHNPKHSW